MRVELGPQGTFQECLDQYLDYKGSSGGSDILKVSFQTLSKDKDRQVEEVVGLIQNRMEPTSSRSEDTPAMLARSTGESY
jgi:hypothetical protein